MATRRKKDPFDLEPIKLPKLTLPKTPKIKEPVLPKITWEGLGFTGLNTIDQFDEKKKRVPIPQSIKTEILLRCKGKCEKCHTSLKGLKPDIHHKNRDPADNRKVNLLVVCPNCHRKLHTK
ncbi:hypothetical protein DSECCO2_229170 [anaerobic digester metagenome]|jgi:hypothetical protein|uniref:HNH endonuclease n=1 Tax=Methanoculleus marisnigri (strain ATCC 35101 / DSM 1498 / JR1) TaxID=368407 RepID=A3CWM7_METMJ|nr:HNH endonuclease [Methanoculleus marisnigri JR1]